MSRPIPTPVGAEQQVTASELVRHFGVWQERAARAPVYILHRNRPRLVLTSVDVMDALCAQHTPRGDASHLTALLDATDAVTMITDCAGTIVHTSNGARARFGDLVGPGAPIGTFASLGGEMLGDAVARVVASGVAETIEVSPMRYPHRRLSCAIEAFPDGCLVRVSDITAIDEARAAESHLAATTSAIDAAGGLVIRVGLRGYLESASPGLAELTGIAPDTLAAARFVTLLDVADRVAAGEAIERTFLAAPQPALSASLIVRGAAARAVRLAFAPLLDSGRPIAAIVAILPQPVP